MCLPTHHPESKNGWNGANNFDLEEKPCAICGHYNTEKVEYCSDPHVMVVFDREGGPYTRTKHHIAVCWECSKTLSEDWWGCG